MADYDSPWKEALEHYLPECLALLAPWLYEAIDWTYAPVFLDKELQALAPDSANSRRYADKLVRLRSKTQRVFWLLLHIEVQGGRISRVTIKSLGGRMYQYYTRISDHHRRPHSGTDLHGELVELISLAILTESQGDAAHHMYEHTDPLGATHLRFRFPVIHLKNWLVRWNELLEHAKTNPFAVVVMAQLMAQKIPERDPLRLATKTSIVRMLYHYNYPRKDARQVLRLIDWMINLAEEHVPVFIDNVVAIEQEYRMTYITSFERYAEQRKTQARIEGLLEGKAEGLLKGKAEGLLKGKAEGLLKGKAEGKLEGQLQGQVILLHRLLSHKFGVLPEAVKERVQTAQPHELETWSLNILDAETLDDVFTR